MDEFFCKTRLFWASTRILFSLAVFYDVYTKFRDFRLTGFELGMNLFILVFAISFLAIGINEFREKETNNLQLLFTGIASIIIAVGLVGLTIGLLGGGMVLLLFLLFSWMVVIGLKDILGNHFYIE